MVPPPQRQYQRQHREERREHTYLNRNKRPLVIIFSNEKSPKINKKVTSFRVRAAPKSWSKYTTYVRFQTLWIWKILIFFCEIAKAIIGAMQQLVGVWPRRPKPDRQINKNRTAEPNGRI